MLEAGAVRAHVVGRPGDTAWRLADEAQVVLDVGSAVPWFAPAQRAAGMHT